MTAPPKASDLSTRDSPRELLADALCVPVESILSFERIKHGLTNDSWRVQTADDRLVARISIAAEDLLQIDRESEARVLDTVSAAGIGPEVVICDPRRQLLVTRDLGTTWSEADAHDRRNIDRLASLLRRLHALPVPSDVRHVDLMQAVRGYIETLERAGCASRLTAQSMRVRGEHAALALREGSIPCLCHNDIHHLNVIDDGTLRLIDWEYAGIGERLFDLASICVYHRYDERERELLLSSYAPSASDAPHRLDLACWLFEYVRELWMEVRSRVET